MGKINRKEFIKNSQIATETAFSHVKFIEHMKKLTKYMLAEIELLQDRVAVLEGRPVGPEPITIPPTVEPEHPGDMVQSEYS
jgi:hypothetical protein